jgi:hypothetical protein
MNQLISSINPVAPSDLLDLAEATFTTNRILFISGSGGSGKTSIACDIAAKTGRQRWLVNLSGQGPHGDMLFAAPDIWPTEKRVGNTPVLLVLDELPDYDPAVRALLRGLYPASGSRYVGPHKLGSNVQIIATGNRRSDGTRSAVEDAPFTERCVKVTLEPNVADWISWYDTQPELLASGSHVPAFLQFGTTSGDGVDHFNPPVVMPYDGAPHPCPRTWEAVALSEHSRKTKDRTYRQLVKGSIGDRAAMAYLSFLQHVDRLPDIASLKANPASFKVPADRSEQYALVSACLATALKGVRDAGVAVASGGFDWLLHLLQQCHGDIATYGAQSAVRRGIPLDQTAVGAVLVIG